MALFNHEIIYDRFLEKIDPTISGLQVRLTYDDAFGLRKNVSLGLPIEVDYVVVGGMATTNPLVLTGVVVGFDVDKAHIYINASDGNVYKCVYSNDEDLQPNDPAMVVEHLNHADIDMNQFDWLVTARAVDFQLNSIKISARDSEGIEICYLNIDPYTGFINFGGMDL